MRIHISNCYKKTKYHYSNLTAQAFKDLGHDVFEFDSEDYSSSRLKIDKAIRRSPFFLLAKKNPEIFDFRQKHRHFINKHWLETIKNFKPDLLLTFNSGWLSYEAVKAARENLRVPKMVCWVVDNPTVSAAEELPNFLLYYDTVFSTDPGWIPFIKFFNNNAFYLPLATSDIAYKPINSERDLDFSFVGSFYPQDPAGFLRALFISNLPVDSRAEIYGPGIDYFKNIYPKLENFNCHDKNIGVDEVNKLWNRSKLTAVIYHPQVVSGTSPRIFDAALAKTPQIIQYTSTASELFPGVNLPLFNSVPEFTAHIDYYLSRPNEREELAEAMFEITKKKHLFSHRIKTMLELLDLR
ncbi:MAG: glycosyltransferase [Patescibacteria group bacterium]